MPKVIGWSRDKSTGRQQVRPCRQAQTCADSRGRMHLYCAASGASKIKTSLTRRDAAPRQEVQLRCCRGVQVDLREEPELGLLPAPPPPPSLSRPRMPARSDDDLLTIGQDLRASLRFFSALHSLSLLAIGMAQLV